MSTTAPTKAVFRLSTDQRDIPGIVKLAREAHAESRFGYVPFSAEKVARLAKAAFKDDAKHAVMLAERDGHFVGIAYCSVGEYHLGTDVLLTTIQNINVSKSVRASLSGGKIALGLFRGIETWSQARGSKEILFHVTSAIGLPQSHKLAKRLGFEFIGGSYAKSLPKS
ncbi:hypothetical protein ACJ5NV_09330 [Loktanella agnita]|uniref:hypothetical protein n=1 Tax=Loktanella agnita TaxID=287097 RepID=UPI003987E06B